MEHFFYEHLSHPDIHEHILQYIYIYIKKIYIYMYKGNKWVYIPLMMGKYDIIYYIV